MRNVLLSSAAVAFVFATVSGADALTRVPQPAAMQQAGTLTCNVAPGIGLGFGSSRPATCVFDHIGHDAFSESYTARFSRVGFDVGLMGSQSVKFSIFTPGGAATPGMLAGTHNGASSEASFVKAPGMQASFGAATRVEFQQASESGWVGLGLGTGDASLRLSAPTEM